MKLRGNIGNMVGKKTPVPTQSTRSRIPVPIGVARGGLRGLGPQRIRKKNIKASLVNLTLNIRYKMTKNIKFVITRFVFSSSKCTKIRFRPGLCPGPRWESLRRSPRPPSRLGRGYPLPIPLPARRLRRLELGLGSQAPLTQNPGYASASSRNCYLLAKKNVYALYRDLSSLLKKQQMDWIESNHERRGSVSAV